jgi:hypothetical protein
MVICHVNAIGMTPKDLSECLPITNDRYSMTNSQSLERRLAAGFREILAEKPSATRRSDSSALPSDFFVLHPANIGRGDRG